jgi:hypothetical protein
MLELIFIIGFCVLCFIIPEFQIAFVQIIMFCAGLAAFFALGVLILAPFLGIAFLALLSKG